MDNKNYSITILFDNGKYEEHHIKNISEIDIAKILTFIDNLYKGNGENGCLSIPDNNGVTFINIAKTSKVHVSEIEAE